MSLPGFKQGHRKVWKSAEASSNLVDIICPPHLSWDRVLPKSEGGGHDPPGLRQPWLLYTAGGRLAFTSFISSSEMTMLTPLGLLNRTPKKGKIWVDNMVATSCRVSALFFFKSKEFRIKTDIFENYRTVTFWQTKNFQQPHWGLQKFWFFTLKILDKETSEMFWKHWFFIFFIF